MSDDYTKLSGQQRRKIIDQVLLIFGNRCHICGLKINEGEESIDHVKSRSKGGLTTIENLRPAHRRCNSAKGARDLADRNVHDGLAFFWPK